VSASDAAQPTAIRQAGPRGLEIVWQDGSQCVLDVVLLRRACRCALCIDEWSGAQILDPEKVPETVRPQRIDPVGRYAISIRWSDGHSSGIYTFEHLKALAGGEPAQRPGGAK